MLRLRYVLIFLLCIYIRSRAIQFSYNELLRKNKEKNDQISALRAQVADLEEKYQEVERKRVQSDEAQAQLKVIGSRANNVLKNRGRELDEKDQKIAILEEKYSLAKYSGGLWAKDQVLLRFPKAKPFIAWIETPSAEDQEPMVDIVGDDDGAS